MLKKIAVLILVIAALGVIFASLKGQHPQDEAPADTTQEVTGPVALPGDTIKIDPQYNGEIVMDCRNGGFDLTALPEGAFAIDVPTIPGETYDVVWYCEGSLAESISRYKGLYRFTYSDDGIYDPTCWSEFAFSDRTDVVCSGYFVASDDVTQLHIFDSDNSTDVDMIYVDGGLLENFKFVVLRRY